MKKCILTAMLLFGLASVADTEVFRLMRDTETGATALVGVDAVPRQVHLLTENEWHFVTNMVCKWTIYMNSSKEGRRALHGENDGGVVVTTNKTGVIVKRQKYEDGYVHEETGVVSRRARNKADGAKITADLMPRPTPRPTHISKRQYEMRQRRERVKKGIPREVTIDHDATTGKDTVR